AVSVKNAARAAAIRLGVDGGRRPKGLPPEFLRCLSHELGETGAAQGRHRILPAAGTLIHVSRRIDRTLEIPSLSGNSDLPLDDLVVGFEFVVRERPVFQG